MGKKKKSQLKPVVRGFATTSVPKKVVAEEEDKDLKNVDDSESSSAAPQKPQPQKQQHSRKQRSQKQQDASDDLAPSYSSIISSGQANEFDPEEQSLQNLVDKQEKIEKEISRTVKVIEMERRFAKSLPRLELDPAVTERIIELALDTYATDGLGHKGLEQPLVEDKLIGKLATTYGVLRRLGFTEERVEECLRAIGGVDLEEAYDWLCLRCPDEEIETLDAPEPIEPRTPRTPYGPSTRIPPTPRTPSQFLTQWPSTPPLITPSRLDANAPIFIPSRFQSDGQVVNVDKDPERERAIIKAHILNNLDHDSSDSGTDMEDPAAAYVKIKLEMDKLQGRERSTLKQLQSRLEEVRNNYFFKEKDAEARYRLERDKADALALKARLQGVSVEATDPPTSTEQRPPSDRPTSTKKRPPNLQPVIAPEPTPEPVPEGLPDIFDEDADDSEGGIFGALEEMPSTITTNQGSVIVVRDMELPKHFSGRTPKTLLAETVSKRDKYAAVTYSLISGGSRAARAGVSIRWATKQTDEFTMDDVACHSDNQAEHYIATVALHQLTFPSHDSFTVTNSNGTATFFRLLPAVFRDLWEELETARKAKADALDRQVWAKMRSIIEPKLEVEPKLIGKTMKDAIDNDSTMSHRNHTLNRETLSEQLAAGFRARQASTPYQDMLVHRNQLPIAAYREEIIQTLEESQILVLSGETGCGKSTQVPAFILEDQLSRGKPCRIYCTEPRRISAISLAQRVSRELGDAPNAVGTTSSLVGYSIRLESNTSRNTRLTFVTNGIALRMLEGGTGASGQGTAFDEITHIIIDEVHERTIESDFLLIVLKTLMHQRSDLKIILMSATVDADKISEFFGNCPTLQVPGRTFPVTSHFLEDVIELTHWELTETSPLARRQHDKFYRRKNEWSEDHGGIAEDEDEEDAVHENVKLEKRYSARTAATINLLDERLMPFELIVRLLEVLCFEDISLRPYSAAILIFMPGIGDIRRLNDILQEHPAFGNGFKIYPLHSTLSSEDQGAVFDVPFGCRKIVIATNIAETGITIPDITCVIDSGKHREMRFDEKRQISRLIETFIARSNAAQRRGRAGRVQAGLCFHLFTKLRHDTQLAEHPLPEMMRLSLSDLALRIKIMKVNLGSSIEDVLSRALDPPVAVNVQRAIAMLVEVGALTASQEITPMGRLLSKLPTDVHLGKFLLTATLFKCLDPALTITATLNAKSPFITPFEHEQEAERAKLAFRVDNSDFLTIHNAFSAWRRTETSLARQFCRKNYLSHQNLQQIEDLRQQFLGYLIDSGFVTVDRLFVRELSRARGKHKTRFVFVPEELDVNSGNVHLLNASLVAGLFPKVLFIDPANGQMRTITNNQVAAFHPSSINFLRRPTDFGVNHLVYFTLMQSKKLYAWETGPVDDIAMLLLCGEADFKLASNSAFIDRKVKFQIPPRCNAALKVLRAHIVSTLAIQFRSRPLTESQVLWNELALSVLGKEQM